MSVAALEALVFHHALATGDREAIALRFFDRVATVIDTAWLMAIGADCSFPQSEGQGPRGTGFFAWYLSRLFRSAHTDGSPTDAFNRVLSMQGPPSSLLHPRIVWRVLKPTRRGAQPPLGRIAGRTEGDESESPRSEEEAVEDSSEES